MIIGLTGENCAGKGTVVAYLQKKSFYALSLSDIIREELKLENKEITRENLIAKGNQLREESGPAVLAKRTIQKLDSNMNYVIDSIRNEHEVLELKKLPNFFLFYVTADVEVRFKRTMSRNRVGDPTTLEIFKELETLELKNVDATKQSLKDAAKYADVKIENNFDLNYLCDAIDKNLAKISSDFKLVRPSWDEYFMSIAKVVASRSNCVKRKVASVIVKDKRIISTGYNGTPRGVTNCSENGCPRCNSFTQSGTNLTECLCSHGEENAIVQASYHGISLKGAVIYTTFSPCLLCTKMILNSGITEVVYSAEYTVAEVPLKLLNEAGVIVRKISE